MKTSSVSLCFLSATLFAGLAFAQAEPPPPPAGAPPPPPAAPGDDHPFRQRMLERFDANHDGKLDEAERAAAREEWKKRMAEHGGPDGFHGPDGPDGPPGFGGPEGGPGRRMERMHHRMMKRWHEEMLAKFDANHDGKLDETERAAARKAGEEMRAKFKEGRQQVLERFDANHDGKLDEAERKALHDAWQDFLKARPALPAAPAVVASPTSA
jgi:Ca2+-binding EF-hand superfamily protein